jgi:hypothetical protein
MLRALGFRDGKVADGETLAALVRELRENWASGRGATRLLIRGSLSDRTVWLDVGRHEWHGRNGSLDSRALAGGTGQSAGTTFWADRPIVAALMSHADSLTTHSANARCLRTRCGYTEV